MRCEARTASTGCAFELRVCGPPHAPRRARTLLTLRRKRTRCAPKLAMAFRWDLRRPAATVAHAHNVARRDSQTGRGPPGYDLREGCQRGLGSKKNSTLSQNLHTLYLLRVGLFTQRQTTHLISPPLSLPLSLIHSFSRLPAGIPNPAVCVRPSIRSQSFPSLISSLSPFSLLPFPSFPFLSFLSFAPLARSRLTGLRRARRGSSP